MKKLTSIIAGVILTLVSGCSFLSQLPPNPPPNPKLEPILPETKIPYDEIEKRAKIVAGLVKKSFPKGVVVYFQGKSRENDRYAAINVLKENRAETLELSLYRGSDPETEEKLNECLLKNDYELAKEILNESGYLRVIFHDSRENGLRKSDSMDYITTRGEVDKEITTGKKEGGEITIRPSESDYLLEQANELYFTFLRKI